MESKDSEIIRNEDANMCRQQHTRSGWLCGLSFCIEEKMKRSANIPIKAGLSLITVLCALAIIGFLPGTIDGAYSGPESVSDSYNFMLFKDGKLIFYRSEQAPADMSGWYQIERNGKVNVYLTTIELGHTDSIFMRATPRRFFTKFEVVETGEHTGSERSS